MKRYTPVFLAGLAFIVVVMAEIVFKTLVQPTGNDLYFPLCGAAALLSGADPYQLCPISWQGRIYPQNPLTTILVAVPFAAMGVTLGSIVLFALCNALLVYAILKHGQPWHFVLFLTPTYYETFFHMQWSVLFAALFLLPNLLPLALVKPQLLVPLLGHLTRWRLLGLVAFGLLSLGIDPWWPVRWLQTAGQYDGFIPVLVFPGLLLALLAWRDRRCLALGLWAITPQRGIYDQLGLFLLASSPKQALALLGCSWAGYALIYRAGLPSQAVLVAMLYVPLLVIISRPYWRTIVKTKSALKALFST